MSNQKITNEMIYELLKQQQRQIGRLEHNQERLEDKIDTQFKEVRADMDIQNKEVRSDIAELKNTRLTWSAGVLAGITMLSSILTLIILRLLSAIGIRLVELPSFLI